jgi:hypothetical protein
MWHVVLDVSNVHEHQGCSDQVAIASPPNQLPNPDNLASSIIVLFTINLLDLDPVSNRIRWSEYPIGPEEEIAIGVFRMVFWLMVALLARRGLLTAMVPTIVPNSGMVLTGFRTICRDVVFFFALNACQLELGLHFTLVGSDGLDHVGDIHTGGFVDNGFNLALVPCDQFLHVGLHLLHDLIRHSQVDLFCKLLDQLRIILHGSKLYTSVRRISERNFHS